jgi:maltooligosyltrehalose trehalohydrolase
MIDLSEVGAFPAAPAANGVPVRFGIYLPGIDPQAGYDLKVRVIQKADRFTPGIAPIDFPLAPVAGSPNNLWQAEVTIPFKPGTSFGASGTYLYRYKLLQKNPGTATETVVVLWFTDPFARGTDDVGQLSAFVTPDANDDPAWQDDGWKAPELADLVVYELQVEEFNRTFDGVVGRLPFLKSLGVTCLEPMPVTSLKLDFDLGLRPLALLCALRTLGRGAGPEAVGQCLPPGGRGGHPGRGLPIR